MAAQKTPIKKNSSPIPTTLIIILIATAFWGARELNIYPFENNEDTSPNTIEVAEAQKIQDTTQTEALPAEQAEQNASQDHTVTFLFGSSLWGNNNNLVPKEVLDAYQFAVDPDREWSTFTYENALDFRQDHSKRIQAGGFPGLNYLRFAGDVGFGFVSEAYSVHFNPDAMEPLLEQQGIHRGGGRKLGDSCNMSISIYAIKASDAPLPLIAADQLLNKKILLYAPEMSNGYLVKDFLKRHDLLLGQSYTGRTDTLESIEKLKDKSIDYIITYSRDFKTNAKEEILTLDSFSTNKDISRVLHEGYENIPCYVIFAKAELPQKIKEKIISSYQSFRFEGYHYRPIPEAQKSYLKKIFTDNSDIKVMYE